MSDPESRPAPESSLQGDADALVDARGLRCPEPLLLARNRMRELGPGQTLRVLATDPTTTRDLRQFCGFLGHEMVSEDTDGEVLQFLIRHRDR